jgi:membrane-associated protease RseP (regulator of RpoE activity)
MRLLRLFLIQAAWLATCAADDVVTLKAVHAPASYIYMRVECVADTDRIGEIRVMWVAPGSTAEKAGLRAGDRLIAINGIPVAGRKRSEVMNASGAVAVRGTIVRFAGRHGFFHPNWILTATIDAQGTMEAIGDRYAPN